MTLLFDYDVEKITEVHIKGIEDAFCTCLTGGKISFDWNNYNLYHVIKVACSLQNTAEKWTDNVCSNARCNASQLNSIELSPRVYCFSASMEIRQSRYLLWKIRIKCFKRHKTVFEMSVGKRAIIFLSVQLFSGVSI